MTKLAGISGKILVKALTRLGYEVVRQRGSHIRLSHPDSKNYPKITVPNHKEVKIGLLNKILKDVHIEPDEFLKLL